MTEQNDSNAELQEHKKNVNEFIDENLDRIGCILLYSVPSEFKAMVITYHKFFNDELSKKFDTKVFYANLSGLDDMQVAYFILASNEQKKDPESVHKECRLYIDKFAEYNVNVTGGVSAVFFDISNSKKIDEHHQGDKSPFMDIKFID